jgi:hypothetical protein
MIQLIIAVIATAALATALYGHTSNSGWWLERVASRNRRRTRRVK